MENAKKHTTLTVYILRKTEEVGYKIFNVEFMTLGSMCVYQKTF